MNVKPNNLDGVLYTKDYNPRITRLTQAELDESRDMIILTWNSAINFIADTIREGLYETVQLPHLGKFGPNYRKIHNDNIRLMTTKPINNEPLPDK